MGDIDKVNRVFRPESLIKSPESLNKNLRRPKKDQEEQKKEDHDVVELHDEETPKEQLAQENPEDHQDSGTEPDSRRSKNPRKPGNSNGLDFSA